MNATENPALAEAEAHQWTWKTPAMERMAVAVCRLALERGPVGEFSANDLKLDDHGGQGIAGVVFHRLAKDDVICPVGTFVGPVFMRKFVTNGGGNPVGVWRIKGGSLARTLLRVHGGKPPRELKQAEFI